MIFRTQQIPCIYGIAKSIVFSKWLDHVCDLWTNKIMAISQLQVKGNVVNEIKRRAAKGITEKKIQVKEKTRTIKGKGKTTERNETDIHNNSRQFQQFSNK